MRRVLIEQNLGKKSKCRFARRNGKKVVIKLVVESQKAVSSPGLTQPLVISGVTVMDFLERFNQETINIEEGLKVKSKVMVYSATKTFELEIGTPSVFEMMRRVFQQEEVSKIKKKNYILVQVVYNIGLMMIINKGVEEFFIKQVKNGMKEILGNLKSYEDFRLLRKKKGKIRIPR